MDCDNNNITIYIVDLSLARSQWSVPEGHGVPQQLEHRLLNTKLCVTNILTCVVIENQNQSTVLS